jgi:hypothetical protein
LQLATAEVRVDVNEEARRVVDAFGGAADKLIPFFSAQLSVLKAQAQVFMGLSGLIITVTGFSGHQMVRGGPFSTVAMILGIALILFGVLLTLRVLGRLRWVSQELRDDLVETAASIITRRNREQRQLSVAGTFVGGGLAFYLVAVVLAALHTGLAPGP